MKILMMLALLVGTVTVFAESNCIDRRSALIEPCPQGKTQFFVQGACVTSYEAESWYCADANVPECVDARATLFPPCVEGESLIYVQGRCEKPYLVEHTYCAVR